jgi:hypothetical protein
MVPDRDEAGPTSAAPTYLSAPTGGSPRARVHDMWDVLKWHDGTLSVAWWALLGLAFLLLVFAGSRAGRR